MEVFVNGRRVMATIINLNVDEGWVEVEDLTALKDVLDLGIKREVDPYLPHEVDLPTKRLYGKVEVKTGKEI